MTYLAPNTTPGTYEFAVCDLLHDYFVRWTQSQIDTYINLARRQLVMDTGCLRSLQASYITGGTEQYFFGQVTGAVVTAGGSLYTAPTIAFTGGGGTGAAATLSVAGGAVNGIAFTSFGVGYTSPPSYAITDLTGSGAQIALGILSANTYDMLGVHLYWGTERYTLQWRAFREFSAWWRPFAAYAYQRQPAVWAVYGDNSIFVGPVPDQSYQVEFDSLILPTPFAVNDSTTPDPIPVQKQDPIPFYAAYLAKRNSKAFGEAESFLQDYRRRLGDVIAAYTGRIPDIYQNG